jgi:channel protein (hemolysin III family)
LLAKVAVDPIPGFYEPVASFSHLLAAPVFAILAVFLLRRGWGSRTRLIFLGIYALSSVFLFSMSGVYHLLPPSGGRTVLERLDHSGIFCLIVGTFTAVHGLLFRGLERWIPLILMWTAGITGITLKVIFFRDVPEWLGLVLYLGLGWMGGFSAVALWIRFGTEFMRPVIWGGIAYTFGGLLEFLDWPILWHGVIGPHELFHIAVLVGAGIYWWFIYRIADGTMPPRASAACQPVESVDDILDEVQSTSLRCEPGTGDPRQPSL